MTNKSSSWTLVAQLSPTPEMKLQQNVTQNGLICVRIIMVICLASPGDLCLLLHHTFYSMYHCRNGSAPGDPQCSYQQLHLVFSQVNTQPPLPQLTGLPRTLQNLDSGLWTGPWTGLWQGRIQEFKKGGSF